MSSSSRNDARKFLPRHGQDCMNGYELVAARLGMVRIAPTG